MDLTLRFYEHAFLVPLQNTLARIVSFVPRLVVAVVLFFAFMLLANFVRRATYLSMKRIGHFPWVVRVLAARTLYFTMLLIGLLAALSSANVNVTTVLASLGVAGFALGFALKDILENFIAGILLLFARPFELEDQVTLGSFEGTVYEIQIRVTTLKTYDNQLVLIPNAQVYTNPVINHTRLGKRNYAVTFETSLKVDSGAVEAAALDAVKQVQGLNADFEPLIRVKSINSASDSVSWQAVFAAQPSKGEEVRTISEALRNIKAKLFDAGIPAPASVSTTILARAKPQES